jgi:hypothetical protein
MTVTQSCPSNISFFPQNGIDGDGDGREGDFLEEE